MDNESLYFLLIYIAVGLALLWALFNALAIASIKLTA